MARPLREIRDEVHSLADEDKQVLLRELIVELDESYDEDAEKAWLDEAHRRLREIDEGVVKPIPAKDVFERLTFPERG